MMEDLTGKSAVITGAASGIGAATATEFVSRGAHVIIADIDEDRGTALAAELGDAAVFCRTDVTREDDIAAAVRAAVEGSGGLDVMVNNAGAVGAWTYVEDTDVAEWDRVFGLLARSAFLGVKHASAVMRQAGGGSIVNVSSVAGVRTGFGPHPYSAAKAAVLQLTRTAAQELAPYSVRVNAVVPGGVATRIVGHGAGLSGADLDSSVDSVRRGLAAFQPIPRAGEGADLAGAIGFLASDASSFITGEALGVDGGLTLGKKWPSNSRAEADSVASRPR